MQPSEYESEILKFRVEFCRVGAYTAIVLILLGIGLDYGLYPAYQQLFAWSRVSISLIIVGVIAMLHSTWGKNNAGWLCFVWLILPQIMINGMIAVTEGAKSMYSIGLYLAIFASSIALPFSLWQNLALSVATFLMYLLACFLHPESFVLEGVFVTNSLFLLFVIILSAVCAFYNERARYMLFRLKSELATKNKQLEETNKSLTEIKGHMVQQEKMAAIGTLAAGLLHEVNNPVNYSLMAIDIARESRVVRDDAMVAECLTDARQGMVTIQNIVSDLKRFAYRSANSGQCFQPFYFVQITTSAMRLVSHETKGINISCDFPKDTLVFGDETAIIGVLVNLLDNAALVMHKHKVVNPRILVSAVWREKRLHVCVEDNGPGIPPENLTRVFEPFFTTREVGQGLGLGLSISYTVVEQHGGKLFAESEMGAWTRMHFDLPAAE